MNIKHIIEEAVKKSITEEMILKWINDEIAKANTYLSDLGMSVVYNPKYDFERNEYYQRCYAIYQNSSVKNNGRIRIGINIPLMTRKIKQKHLQNEVKISIWHEIGHGIVEYLKGLRRKDTQCGTKIFKGIMLYDFKYIIGDEENCVEEFGRYKADQTSYSDLDDFLRRYEKELITIRNQEGGGKWLQHFKQNNEPQV